MSRKPRVDRSPEEKWQIVQEGMKSGNIWKTCRRHGIAANLYYRWRDEAEQGAKAALGGRSAAARNRKRPSHPATRTHAGAQGAGDRNPKKRRGGVSCGAAHSQAREMMAQRYTATLVATTLAISRSSFITARSREAVGPIESTMSRSSGVREKLAYGYRRVGWWRTEQRASRESQACATRDARTWFARALSSSARTTQERVGPRGSCRTESNLANGHDGKSGQGQLWAGRIWFVRLTAAHGRSWDGIFRIAAERKTHWQRSSTRYWPDCPRAVARPA